MLTYRDSRRILYGKFQFDKCVGFGASRHIDYTNRYAPDETVGRNGHPPTLIITK